MTKRILTLLIMTLAFILLLTACGGNKATDDNATDGNATDGNVTNASAADTSVTDATASDSDATDATATNTAAPTEESASEEVTKPDVSSSDVFGKFKTVDINGKTVDFTALMGKKVTMVNVWATFCTPCIGEMPDLEKINKNYADKDFQIVGMVLDVSEYGEGGYDGNLLNEAKKIISDTGVTYLNLLTSRELLNNELSQVFSVPTTYFLDENGNLIGNSYIGSRSYDDWAQIIDELLAR